MSLVNQDGWPVDLDRLPSWERRGDKVHQDDAIFRFFQCPCSRMGGKRKPHRISTCDYILTTKREDTPDVMLEKRLRSATTPMRSVILR